MNTSSVSQRAKATIDDAGWFAVLDGHGGRDVAKYAKATLRKEMITM